MWKTRLLPHQFFKYNNNCFFKTVLVNIAQGLKTERTCKVDAIDENNIPVTD